MVTALALCALALAGWRPLAAWWGDAAGNRALVRGRSATAIAWFDRALRLEPGWALLHEDRGRALMDRDPSGALAEFDRADCGAACAAEAGDALVRLGRPHEAIDRYIAAKAVSRVSRIALELSRRGRDVAAIALMGDLIGRMHDDFLERADLASSYATLGAIQADAAAARPAQARELRADAIASYAAASRLAPYNEGFLLSLGFAEMRWGDPAVARRAFERLLEIHPHQADAERALAKVAGPRARAATPLRSP